MNPEDLRDPRNTLANISPAARAKLDALNLVPCPIILTTGDHDIVWHNQAFHDTYSQRIPNMDKGNVAAMFGCALGPNPQPGSFGEICLDCPLYRAYTDLDHQESTVQHGSVLMPFPWGNAELNVKVTAQFITLDDRKLYMLAISDREVAVNRYEINRSLFHDLLNIGQQMRSSTNLARMTIEDAQREGYRIPTQLTLELQIIGESLTTLTNLINAQRQLNNAQAHTLRPNITEFSPAKLLQTCVDTLRSQDDCAGRLPILVPGPTQAFCHNDVQLLQQVIYALLHTMVFASRSEQIIELGYTVGDDKLELWIRNRELQLADKKILQLKRTYSFKRIRSIHSHTLEILLPYIQGDLRLASPPGEGTTFTISLPLTLT